MWSPRDIEDRLEEAALTLRRLPNPAGSGARGHGSSWPEYVHEAKHAYGYEQATMRVIPNAREIQRMEEALEWLMLVGGRAEQAAIDDRRIVWMRADGYRWRQVCREIGCSRATAWRRWTAALITIANRLNANEKKARGRAAKKEAANEGGGSRAEGAARTLL